MTASNRTSRQQFLGEQSDRVFAESRVAVVGLCGGGSHVAQQLAHIGVGRFVLLDNDKTELSNLNRMVGSRLEDAQLRTEKTDVIKRVILNVNPDAEVVARSTTWQDNHQLLRDCSVVFGCVDSFLARDDLERYCRRFLLPYIDVGMDVKQVANGYSISGQVVTSIPGMPCMRCVGFLSDELVSAEIQQYGAAGPRPQVVWPNGVLASTAVGQFVKMISPWSKPDLELYLEYDGNKPSLTPSRFLHHVKGKTCKHFSALTDLGDSFE